MRADYLRTFIFYFFFLIAVFIGLVPCFFLSLLPESIRYDNKLYYFFMSLFYRIAYCGLQVPVTFKGIENLPNNSALYVANHQSALDVLMLGVLLSYKPHCWLFKVELTKIPLYGFMAKRMNVAVDRTTPRKALVSLLEGIRRAKCHNQSLIIFPEGSRFSDGKIHDFLWGFAIIARKTGKPVVPVLIMDAYKVYPMGSFLISYYPINVFIGKPFILQENETDEEFVSRVQSWFIEHYKG